MSSQELEIQKNEDKEWFVVNRRQRDILDSVLELTENEGTHNSELTHRLEQLRIALWSHNHETAYLESSFLKTREVLL